MDDKDKLVELLKQLLNELEGQDQKFENVEQNVLAGELSAIPNQILQSVKKSISMQEGKIQKQKVSQLFIAGCGHIIHDVSEVGGKCTHGNCNSIVCLQCLKACERCMKLICPKHQKVYRGSIFCPRCYWIALLFGTFSKERQEDRSKRHFGVADFSRKFGEALFGK
jgi:hypothetical protein